MTSGKLGLVRGSLLGAASAMEVATQEKSADYTLQIGAAAVDIGKKTIVSAVTYNGQFPGPLLGKLNGLSHRRFIGTTCDLEECRRCASRMN